MSFKSLIIVIIIAIGGYGISKSINNDITGLDTLTLANVEALANDEEEIRDCVWYIQARFVGDDLELYCVIGGTSCCEYLKKIG